MSAAFFTVIGLLISAGFIFLWEHFTGRDSSVGFLILCLLLLVAAVVAGALSLA